MASVALGGDSLHVVQVIDPSCDQSLQARGRRFEPCTAHQQCQRFPTIRRFCFTVTRTIGFLTSSISRCPLTSLFLRLLSYSNRKVPFFQPMPLGRKPRARVLWWMPIST